MNELLSILTYAAPVAIAALGETVVQRAGVLQIGLEGLMLSGAFAAAAVTAATGNPLLGLAAGVVVGLLGSLLSALFCVTLRADQVVVGTALNLLALGATGALFRIQFGATGRLPSFPKLSGFDGVLLLTLLLAPLFAWLLHRSNFGLVARAAGEMPKAVEASGFRVNRIRYVAMAIGGLAAGLAGAYLSVGIVGSFAENMTSGRGFVAIAVVTFGRWKPFWVLAASLLIGWLESLQFSLQASGLKVPYQLMLALPYLAALAVLVIAGKGTRGPAALGQPYEREA